MNKCVICKYCKWLGVEQHCDDCNNNNNYVVADYKEKFFWVDKL